MVFLGDWIPPDQILKTPTTILTSRWFDQFKHTLPEIDPEFVVNSVEELYTKQIWMMPTVDPKKIVANLSRIG